MLIENLLQFLVNIIDTDLLKTVVVKYFEPSNVKDTNVGNLFHCWVAKGFVTFVYNNTEATLIDGTSNTRNRVSGSCTS